MTSRSKTSVRETEVVSIRFGVSPIAWVNDDMPELGGDTPLSTILADARDIGFAGVELGGKFPRDAAVLKSLLDGYGLDLIGGWYSGELLARDVEAEIAAAQAHLALLKAMGSTVFVHAETSNAIHGQRGVPLSGSPRLDAAEWAAFGARMTGFADYIADQGLRFAYHHHLGTVVERPDDLAAFLKVTGASVGLTLDTGHAALGGIDPVAAIRAHPERIAHVHCKDVRRAVFAEVQARRTRASWRACSPACSPCPATAGWTMAPSCGPSPTSAMRAGSSSRPNRTRRWPIPGLMANSACAPWNGKPLPPA
jgi:inosose dehydratase